MSRVVNLEIPPKLIPVFEGPARYRGAHGGRGSGKTRTFARMAAVRAMMHAQNGRSGVVLCGREFMNSLEDSSMQEVKQAIQAVPWLDDYFDIGERYIRTRNRKVHFVFAGLRHNLDSIKSKARILLSWIDEAENVSKVGWQKLVPTVREEESEIWVTWNPEKEDSPTDIRFRKTPPRSSKIVQMNYHDNPWFPEVLEEERQNDQERLDDATYAHIWDGEYLKNSTAQIFANKYRVKEFVPDKSWDGPYQGLDWGFSQDPLAAVRCWIHKGRLYVEHEASKVKVELDDTKKFVCDRIEAFDRFVTRADSARPESISYVNRHGLPRVVAAEKGPGSVEDGIAHMRSYIEIVIHPRCIETVKEFRIYSYKTDRLSGDVLTDIIDAHNHHIDAIRYALEPVMKRSRYKIGEAL